VVELLAERGVDGSARTVLTGGHPCSPRRAEAGGRRSRTLGPRWGCEAPYSRRRGRWAYLYRAIDEGGPVGDVLLREHRDLDSARACLARASQQRGVTPAEVIPAGHPAYRRASQDHAPRARPVVTGRHRAAGSPTPQPIERAPGPIKDRVRPRRGVQAIATGQRRGEGVTRAQVIRRGDVAPAGAGEQTRLSVPGRARRTGATFHGLAGELRLAS
jgi:transposase-like protein